MGSTSRGSAHEPLIYLRGLGSRFGNEQGAREGWEHLITWLVQLDHPEAKRIEARRGDGGIDVVVGDLAGGDLTIWQAKYFGSVSESQKKQIKNSFRSAVDSAAGRGNRVVTWVLCIPTSLDLGARAWWDRWRVDNQRQYGIRIELWDETKLVRLIARAKAADLRHYFFGGSYTGRTDMVSAAPLPPPALASQPWSGGGDLQVGTETYLLYDEPEERTSTDRSVVWREATADQIGPSGQRVYLRQVQVIHDTPAAAGHLSGLREQARLLTDIAGRAGLPHLLTGHDDGCRYTVITARPSGPTWREVFGPSTGPLDRVTAAGVCAAAMSLCVALAELHRLGHSHRALSPDSIIVNDRLRRALPRDAGLVAIPPSVGEGPTPYRAPEQTIGYNVGTAVGPHTDLYQLGCLLYHTVTSHQPTGPSSPPMMATNPDVPPELDEVVRRCMDRAPNRRPAEIGRIVTVLADARRRLSQGANQ